LTEIKLADDYVVTVEDLQTHFSTQEGLVRAVDGASFVVRRGRILGVVGESGCGKSVTAQSILQIVPNPGKVVGGKILYHRKTRENDASAMTEEIDITSLDPRGRQMRAIRGSEIAMVFQEPMTSLNPVYTIGNHLMEAITLHQDVSKNEARRRAIDILSRVGMPQPERVVDNYPHQLSGGMRQRAMIAIGLSCNPSLLIADEPTTALDVTTEAQILDLMRDLQAQMAMAIMYITHDLGVVAEICDEVIVMYLGKVVEEASIDDIFYKPKHPYTQALLKSIPLITSAIKERLEPIQGIVPDPYTVIPGCPFWPRCPRFIPGTCDVTVPDEIALDSDHRVRCHLYN
jgi:oligopeptide/dipeptide ABC transporter ATP-binding protein